MAQKVIWHPNMAPSFSLLHITNEMTLKLKQIDRLPALPRFSPQKHVPTTLVGIPVDIYTCWYIYCFSSRKRESSGYWKCGTHARVLCIIPSYIYANSRTSIVHKTFVCKLEKLNSRNIWMQTKKSKFVKLNPRMKHEVQILIEGL